MPSFYDNGTYNLRDLDNNVLVGKIHVELPPADVAGGRGYVIHKALLKTDPNETGWGVYAKPTLSNNKQLKWEGTNETLTQFINWVSDSTRKPKLRYGVATVREQDSLP